MGPGAGGPGGAGGRPSPGPGLGGGGAGRPGVGNQLPGDSRLAPVWQDRAAPERARALAISCRVRIDPEQGAGPIVRVAQAATGPRHCQASRPAVSPAQRSEIAWPTADAAQVADRANWNDRRGRQDYMNNRMENRGDRASNLQDRMSTAAGQIGRTVGDQLQDGRGDRLENREDFRDNFWDNAHDLAHDHWHNEFGDWWDHMWEYHPCGAASGLTAWGVNRLSYWFGYGGGYYNPYYSRRRRRRRILRLLPAARDLRAGNCSGRSARSPRRQRTSAESAGSESRE